MSDSTKYGKKALLYSKNGKLFLEQDDQIMKIKTKVCYACKQEKDCFEYGYNSRTKDYMNTQCKKCVYARRNKTELEIIQKTTKDYDLKW